MKRPIILCTPSSGAGDLHVSPYYFTCLLSSGAIPMLLPMTDDTEVIEQLVSMADGFLFTGGVDLNPELYGESRLPECGEVDEARDRTEIALFKAAIRTGKPIFGICRGIQSINTAAGGSLWQDLPSQHPSDLRHAQAESPENETQTVSVVPGTLLASVLGRDGAVRVNSHHHQGVKKAADGFIVSAQAEDGVTEAIEMPGHPYCLGVQWHPERLAGWDPIQKSLFDAFVNAAKK